MALQTRIGRILAKPLKSLHPKTCVLNRKAHRFGEYRLSGERFGRFRVQASTQVFAETLEILGFLTASKPSGEWFEN
jgi:hypothetical protein